MPKKINTKLFIEKARKVHGDFYDYSKVDYVNNHTQITIVCPIHGEFKQLPMVHLRGSGCYLCGKNKISNKLKKEKPTIIKDKDKIIKEKREKLLNDFIEKARKVHGDKYDYSKVEYINNSTKVCIIDEDGEEFWQRPANHLKCQGNPKNKFNLIRKKLASTTEEFIEKSRKIHGDKYDYTEVDYVNNRTKVCLICPIHGEFMIAPDKHLMGRGCAKCGAISKAHSQSLGKDEFIKRARKVHGDKYDYSKVEYKNNNKPVCIICPKHGEFLQPPQVHLDGSGCNLCHCNKMEVQVSQLLIKYNIEFVHQKGFEWLRYKKPLKLDFYLPLYNVAIECQGEQHFQPIKYFGGDKKFIQNLERDKSKRDLCEKHGIKIYYYSNLEIDDENIYTNIIELIETIKSENDRK